MIESTDCKTLSSIKIERWKDTIANLLYAINFECTNHRTTILLPFKRLRQIHRPRIFSLYLYRNFCMMRLFGLHLWPTPAYRLQHNTSTAPQTSSPPSPHNAKSLPTRLSCHTSHREDFRIPVKTPDLNNNGMHLVKKGGHNGRAS